MTTPPFTFPSRLYAIADASGGRDPVETGHALLDGGARVLQLRWKNAPTGSLLAAALRLRSASHAHGAFFVVNDRIDVALATHADAVHLGQDDLPLEAARRIVGDRLRIGVSTHDLDQAQAAAAGGADYLGFGPIHRTITKATGYDPRGIDALSVVAATVDVPIVAIGGIRRDNAVEALGAGAAAVAVIADLVASGDPRSDVTAVLAAIEGHAIEGAGIEGDGGRR